MFHCLFIVLKVSLFSKSSSHDPVIKMFHCLFIVLKISLFSMSSSHDPVIKMFHCLFIVLKISLFSKRSNHDPVIKMCYLPTILLRSNEGGKVSEVWQQAGKTYYVEINIYRNIFYQFKRKREFLPSVNSPRPEVLYPAPKLCEASVILSSSPLISA